MGHTETVVFCIGKPFKNKLIVKMGTWAVEPMTGQFSAGPERQGPARDELDDELVVVVVVP